MLSDVNVSVSLFSADSKSDKIYKKVERLMTATFMVTDSVPDSEALKKFLRLSVISLLNNAVLQKSARDADELILEIRKILSALDTFFVLGFISEMNVAVLKEAYMNFAKFLELSPTQNLTLKRELFFDNDNISELEKQNEQSEILVREMSLPTSKESESKPVQNDFQLQSSEYLNKEKRATVVRKKIENDNKVLTKKAKNKSLRSRARSGGRRSIIIDLVTKKGSVTVRDIADEITDCSTKTLQRELLSLVADNVLSKEGERRWTTYSLAV